MAIQASPEMVAEAMDNIVDALERLTASVTTLKSILLPKADLNGVEFDPKDPANKYEIGGLNKLTPRGEEICYRLFDAGKTRYAVCNLLEISFGAANHRLEMWKKDGGSSRVKRPLETL